MKITTWATISSLIYTIHALGFQKESSEQPGEFLYAEPCLKKNKVEAERCIVKECVIPRVEACGNFDLFGEFLYWEARQDQLQYAIDIKGGLKSVIDFVTGPAAHLTQKISIAQAAFEWKPGFRVGAGYFFSCSDWDITLFWTWLHEHTTTSISDPNNGIFPSEFPASSIFDLDTQNPTLGNA